MVIAKNIKQSLTLEEFLEIPETKPAREYINGVIYQKPMPQGEYSTLQGELVSAINKLGKSQKLAYAFPELRCTFGGRSFVPDVAVFSWQRIPKTPQGKIANKFEIYPDWIIEILSPEQSPNKVIKKILFCLKQGTELGWLIDPEDESVMILKPNQLPEIFSELEILPVLNILDNWQLTVKNIFDWLII
ncbi:Uma2 family endonuclease [Crocosphaera sp. UHCC 0190]|uniref:Uma2 family endonuclease n=1 Tax=Crocosphaera sp. UHCC 0190 TaxID=3110246 RepID=UPI002B202385|nr:Uma2 family endonuclease [Crocosphaera sp. UHCC 0190]MEA5509785.1 Uma2 family endonuclease [Crocosphaera sp. UHCC 0190]